MLLMYVLGVYSGHNATAALLKDGKVAACVSEERFRRVKNYRGFPEKAIEYALDYAGVKKDEVGLVCLSYNFGVPAFSPSGESKTTGIVMRMISAIYRPVGIFRNLHGASSYHLPLLQKIGDPVSSFLTRTVGGYIVGQEKKFLSKYLGIPLSRIKSFDHHLCHAASAYYCSPFNQEKALVFTLDAEGDLLCATVSIFEGEKNKRIAQTFHTHSLGWVYNRLTLFLGMKSNEHEYKIMGLAPYAQKESVDKVYQKIKNIVTLDPRNPLVFTSPIDTRQTLRYLERNMTARFRFDHIAGAFQRLVEERIVEWVSAGIEETGIRNIACGGGVFMNVKANQKVAGIEGLENLFVMPSSGDESTAIGAAILGYLGF